MPVTKQLRILAITLNWQQPGVTQKCVQTLEAMNYPGLDILVVDNGSNDDSAVKLRASLSGKHKLLALPVNSGFAQGNNAALQIALQENYDYALLINNDAFAAPDMLAQLLNEAEPDIGLLSPKIFYESEPERIWFGNGDKNPLTLDLRNTGRGEFDSPKWALSRDVDYLLGTCLLVNLEAVRQTGLLDSIFFMYFEDLDWSIRMRKAGFRLRLVSTAHLCHRVATSTGSQADSPLRRYHLARSSVIFWRRYLRLGNPFVIILFRFGSALKMMGRLILTGQWDTAVAYLNGLHDGWKVSR
jgi:GT2 family glycosyltransferase